MITIYHSKQLQEGLIVFSDDFLHFLKIKIFFYWIHQNYLVALRLKPLVFTWASIDLLSVSVSLQRLTKFKSSVSYINPLSLSTALDHIKMWSDTIRVRLCLTFEAKISVFKRGYRAKRCCVHAYFRINAFQNADSKRGAFMLNFWGQNQCFQTWLEQNAVASMLIFDKRVSKRWFKTPKMCVYERG